MWPFKRQPAPIPDPNIAALDLARRQLGAEQDAHKRAKETLDSTFSALADSRKEVVRLQDNLTMLAQEKAKIEATVQQHVDNLAVANKTIGVQVTEIQVANARIEVLKRMQKNV